MNERETLSACLDRTRLDGGSPFALLGRALALQELDRGLRILVIVDETFAWVRT